MPVVSAPDADSTHSIEEDKDEEEARREEKEEDGGGHSTPVQANFSSALSIGPSAPSTCEWDQEEEKKEPPSPAPRPSIGPAINKTAEVAKALHGLLFRVKQMGSDDDEDDKGKEAADFDIRREKNPFHHSLLSQQNPQGGGELFPKQSDGKGVAKLLGGGKAKDIGTRRMEKKQGSLPLPSASSTSSTPHKPSSRRSPSSRKGSPSVPRFGKVLNTPEEGKRSRKKGKDSATTSTAAAAKAETGGEGPPPWISSDALPKQDFRLPSCESIVSGITTNLVRPSSVRAAMEQQHRGREGKEANDILDAVRQSHVAQQEAIKALLKKEDEKREQRRQEREAERMKKKQKKQKEKEQKARALEDKKEKARQKAIQAGKLLEEIDEDDLSISFSVGDSSSSVSSDGNLHDSSSSSSWSSDSSSSLPSGLLNAFSSAPTVFPLNMANLSRLEKQLELLREQQHQEEGNIRMMMMAEQQGAKGSGGEAGAGVFSNNNAGGAGASRKKQTHLAKKIEQFEQAITQAISALQDTPNASLDASPRLDALFAELGDLSLPSPTSAMEGVKKEKKMGGGVVVEGSEGAEGRGNGGFSIFLSPPSTAPAPVPGGGLGRTSSIASSAYRSSVGGLPTIVLHPSSIPKGPSPSLPSGAYPTNNKLQITGILAADPLFASLSVDGSSSVFKKISDLLSELKKLKESAKLLESALHIAGSEDVIENDLRRPIKAVTQKLEEISRGSGSDGQQRRRSAQAASLEGQKHPKSKKNSKAVSHSSSSCRSRSGRTPSTSGEDLFSDHPSPTHPPPPLKDVEKEGENLIGLGDIRQELVDLNKEVEGYMAQELQHYQKEPKQHLLQKWRRQLSWCKEEMLRCKEKVEGAVREATERRLAVRHSTKRNILDPLPPRLDAIQRHLVHILQDREIVVNTFLRFQEAVCEDDAQLLLLQQHMKQATPPSPGGESWSGNMDGDGSMVDPGRPNNTNNSELSSLMAMRIQDSSTRSSLQPMSTTPEVLQEIQGRHDHHKEWVGKVREKLMEVDDEVKHIQRDQLEEMAHTLPALFDTYSKDLRHEEEKMEKAAERATIRLKDALEDLQRLYTTLPFTEEDEDEREEEEEEEAYNDKEDVSLSSDPGGFPPRQNSTRNKTKCVTASIDLLEKKEKKVRCKGSKRIGRGGRKTSTQSASSPFLSEDGGVIIRTTPSSQRGSVSLTPRGFSVEATVTSPTTFTLPTPLLMEKMMEDHDKDMLELADKLREEKEKYREIVEKAVKNNKEELQRIKEAEERARVEREEAERALEEERQKRLERERKKVEEELRKELKEAKNALHEEEEKRRKNKRDNEQDDEEKEESEPTRSKEERELRGRRRERPRGHGEEEHIGLFLGSEDPRVQKVLALEAALKAQEERHQAELKKAEKELEKERAEKREAQWKAQEEREKANQELMAERLRALEDKLEEQKALYKRDMEAAQKMLQKEQEQRELELERTSKNARDEQQRLQQQAAQALQDALQKQEQEHEKKLRAAETALERERAFQKEREKHLLNALAEAKKGTDEGKVKELESALHGQQQEQLKALETAVLALDQERERHAREREETVRQLSHEFQPHTPTTGRATSPSPSPSRGLIICVDHTHPTPTTTQKSIKNKKRKKTGEESPWDTNNESLPTAHRSGSDDASISTAPTEDTENDEVLLRDEKEKYVGGEEEAAGARRRSTEKKDDDGILQQSMSSTPKKKQKKGSGGRRAGMLVLSGAERRALSEQKLKKLENQLEQQRDINETKEGNLEKYLEKVKNAGFRSRAEVLKKDLEQLKIRNSQLLAEKEAVIRDLRAHLRQRSNHDGHLEEGKGEKLGDGLEESSGGSSSSLSSLGSSSLSLLGPYLSAVNSRLSIINPGSVGGGGGGSPSVFTGNVGRAPSNIPSTPLVSEGEGQRHSGASFPTSPYSPRPPHPGGTPRSYWGKHEYGTPGKGAGKTSPQHQRPPVHPRGILPLAIPPLPSPESSNKIDGDGGKVSARAGAGADPTHPLTAFSSVSSTAANGATGAGSGTAGGSGGSSSPPVPFWEPFDPLLSPHPPRYLECSDEDKKRKMEKAALLAARRRLHLPPKMRSPVPNSDQKYSGKGNSSIEAVLRRNPRHDPHAHPHSNLSTREENQRILDALSAKHDREMAQLQKLVKSNALQGTVAAKTREKEIKKLQVTLEGTTERLRRVQVLLDDEKGGGAAAAAAAAGQHPHPHHRDPSSSTSHKKKHPTRSDPRNGDEEEEERKDGHHHRHPVRTSTSGRGSTDIGGGERRRSSFPDHSRRHTAKKKRTHRPGSFSLSSTSSSTSREVGGGGRIRGGEGIRRGRGGPRRRATSSLGKMGRSKGKKIPSIHTSCSLSHPVVGFGSIPAPEDGERMQKSPTHIHPRHRKRSTQSTSASTTANPLASSPKLYPPRPPSLPMVSSVDAFLLSPTAGVPSGQREKKNPRKKNDEDGNMGKGGGGGRKAEKKKKGHGTTTPVATIPTGGVNPAPGALHDEAGEGASFSLSLPSSSTSSLSPHPKSGGEKRKKKRSGSFSSLGPSSTASVCTSQSSSSRRRKKGKGKQSSKSRRGRGESVGEREERGVSPSGDGVNGSKQSSQAPHACHHPHLGHPSTEARSASLNASNDAGIHPGKTGGGGGDACHPHSKGNEKGKLFPCAPPSPPPSSPASPHSEKSPQKEKRKRNKKSKRSKSHGGDTRPREEEEVEVEEDSCLRPSPQSRKSSPTLRKRRKSHSLSGPSHSLPSSSKTSLKEPPRGGPSSVSSGGVYSRGKKCSAASSSSSPSSGTSQCIFTVSLTKRIPYSTHSDGASPTVHLLSSSAHLPRPDRNASVSNKTAPLAMGAEIERMTSALPHSGSPLKSEPRSVSSYREYRSTLTVGGGGSGVAVVSPGTPRDYSPQIRERAGVYTVVQGAQWLSDMYKKEPFYSKKVENSVEELGSLTLLTPHRKKKHGSSKIPSPLFRGSREAEDGIPLPAPFHTETSLLCSINSSRRNFIKDRRSSSSSPPPPSMSSVMAPIPRRDEQLRASRMKPATP